MHIRRNYEGKNSYNAFKDFTMTINNKLNTKDKREDHDMRFIMRDEIACARRYHAVYPPEETSDEAAAHYLVARHELRSPRAGFSVLPIRNPWSEQAMNEATEAIVATMLAHTK